MLRFQTFRVLICTVIALTACTAIFLGAFVTRNFIRQGFGWLLVAIESFSALRCVWSKPWFATPQPVASEAIGLFVLAPFQLIIILVISSSSSRGSTHVTDFNYLKGIAITSAALHLGYAAGLILIAALTVAAYDGDVWLRDIDSSPSPFPLEILFAAICPCLARRIPAMMSLVPQRRSLENPPNVICLPGCSCLGGDRACSKLEVPTQNQAEDATQPSQSRPVSQSSSLMDERRRPPVLAHTLVRIPNAAERRASIYIELPIEV